MKKIKLSIIMLILIMFVISIVHRTSIKSEIMDYDNNSFILQDLELKEVKQIAKHYNATYSNLEDSKTSIIYLNENIDVDDVFSDDFFTEYQKNATKNYYATFFDYSDDYYSSPITTLNTEQFHQQEYLNYINLGDVASHRTYVRSRVALIDTGIDLSHPDLSDVYVSNDSYNVSLGKKVYEDSVYDYSIIEDEIGHGTNVAGIIAGSGNILGINSYVELIVIKVSPTYINGRLSVSNDELIKALDYISTIQVDVVNMSWGIYAEENPFENQINKIIENGTVCVASAGNDRTSNISYPAADENVVSVGAYDYETKQLADYSNYGNAIDIVAPGKVYTTDLNSKYKKVTGTSYASAIVTAALSHLNGYQYAYDSILSSGSIDLGERGKDFYYGNGLIDVSKIVYSKKSNITFNMLCEEVAPIVKTYVDGGIMQSLPIPERIYEHFAGWYYDSNLTKKVNYYYDSFSGNITLYAKWVSNSYSGESLFTYKEVENGEIEITGYTGNRQKIAIPEIIDGKTVVGIADRAFYNSNMKIVELPKTLKYIGKNAFSGSSQLKEINIPDSLKLIDAFAFSDCGSLANINISDNSKLEEILDYAFYNTNIKSIYIPKGVFEIGVLALSSNSIDTIEVHKNNLSYKAYDNVLYNKLMTKLIYYPTSKIGSFTVPNTVKTISLYAFYRSKLADVNLSNVEVIESNSFQLSSINDIQIPSTVNSFGDYVFSRSSINNITILEGVKKIPEFTFESASISKISLPKSLESIEGGAFYKCEVEDLILPSDSELKNILTYVGFDGIFGAFEASTIKSFTAPNTLVYIGFECFNGCSLLESVDLSQSQITTILDDTFSYTGLTNIKLPECLKKIENDAFAYSNLSALNIGKNVYEIGSGFLTGNDNVNLTIDEENNWYTVENSTLYSKDKTIIHTYCGSKQYLTIPSTVEKINDLAFKQNKYIEGLNFESSSNLSYIGNEAFKETNIRSFYFGENIIYLGVSSFEGCKELTTITFDPNISLKTISKSVFKNCSIITIAIPNSVEVIDDYAFYNNKISELILSENVKEVGGYAFYDNNIYSLQLNDGLINIGVGSFSKHILSSLYIPSSVERIDDLAFAGDPIHSLTFEDNCKISEIGDYSFGRLSIFELVVPASLEHLGVAAFNGVTKLVFEENSKLTKLDMSSISGNYSTTSFEQINSSIGVKEIYFNENSSLLEIVGTLGENLDILVIDLQNTKLEKISELAFSNCKNLNTIKLPNTIKEIETYAFLNCKNISSIYIPSSIEVIENYAFFDCKISIYFNGNSLPTGAQTYWDSGVTEYFFGVYDVYTEGDFIFMNNNLGKTLVEYKGTAKEVDLSSYNISFIGSNAFTNTSVEKVILPQTIVGINQNAFAYSTIKEINIPSSVKYIDSYAFYNSNIKNITFDSNSNLNKISKFAFANCYYLNTVSLPDSLETIEGYAFYHSNIRSIDFNDNILLTEINEYTFAYTKLETITIPTNITNIGIGAFSESKVNYINFNDKDLVISERAFYMADLLEVYIPANVTYIGEYTFSGNVNLTKFEVVENNENYSSFEGSLFNKNKTTLICVPAAKTGNYSVLSSVEDIAKGAFEYSNIESIEFPNNNALYIINTRSFFNAKQLEKIVIPSSVVYIDYYAFAYCDNLKEVIFEDNSKLQGIYEGAFYYCKSLEYFNVPKSVSEISDYAFYGCVNLTNFDFTNIEEIRSYAFAYSGIEEFIITGTTLKYLGESSFSNSNLRVISLDYSLKNELIIELGVFKNCNKLEELTTYFIYGYPIAYYFGGINNYENSKYVPNTLKRLIINDSFTVLPEYAFYGLSMLEFIDIPDECTMITEGCFTDVTAYIELPDNISFDTTILDNSYLSRGSVINKLVFDDNMESVSYALSDIDTIKELYFNGSNIEIGRIRVSNIEKIYFSNDHYFKYLENVFTKDATIVLDFDLPTYINSDNFDELYYSVYNGNNYVYLTNGEYKHLDTVYYNDSFEKTVFLNRNIDLENVYISNSVKELSYFGFLNNLKNVYYDGTLEEWMQITISSISCNPMNYADNFYYKDSSNNWILFEELILPEDTKVINEYQFVGFNIEELTISNEIETIGTSAFSNITSLKTLNIYCREDYDIYRIFGDTVNSIKNVNIIGGNIPYDIFYYFEELDKVTISSDIKVHNSNLFDSTNVKEFNYLGTIEQWLEIDMETMLEFNNVEKVLINSEEVKELVIPNTITTIKKHQFSNFKNLEKVVMSDSVISIEEYAFYNCTLLREIQFSKNLNHIGNCAFYHCTSLENISLYNEVLSIGDSAFAYCTNLQEIKLSDKLNSIGYSVFYECNLVKELEIPESVTYIGRSLFSTNSTIEKLTIPFLEGTVGEYLNYGFYDYGDSTLKELVITNATYIPYDAFRNCGNLEKIVVSNKTTEFSNSFLSAKNLKTIEYQGDIYEYLNCSGFEILNSTNLVLTNQSSELVIDDTTPEIGSKLNRYLGITKLSILTSNAYLNNSFYDCSNLKTLEIINTDITIPEQLKNQLEEITVLSGNTIPSEYFLSFSSVKKITLPNTITTIDYLAFAYCELLEEIIMSDSLETIGSYAFQGCLSLKEVTLPEGITSIGDYAFYGCSSLSKINLPSSLNIIGSAVFYNCAIVEIYIPYIENLGYSIFSGCKALTKVILAEEIKYIPMYMFEECSSLTTIEMPSVEIIDTEAFSDCISLKEIVLPASINNIAYRAFENSGLTKVIFEEGFSYKFYSFGNDISIFDSTKNIKEAVIPNSLLNIDFTIKDFETIYYNGSIEEFNNCSVYFKNVKYLYINNELVIDLVLPEGIETINSHYSSLIDLKTVTIPKTVKDISSTAFKDCYNLHTVYNLTDNDTVSEEIRNSYFGKILYSDGSTYGESYERNVDGLIFYFRSLSDTYPRLIRYDGDLETIILPEKLDNMEYTLYKFNNGSLKDITIPNSVSINNESFIGSTINKLTICDYDKGWNSFTPLKDVIEEIEIVNLQGGYIYFEGFSKLKKVSFVNCDDITTLEPSLFKDCVSLESIKLPNNLVTMERLFVNCISLTTVEIPSSVKALYSSFEGCVSLENIVLPEGLEVLDDFYGCTSLKSIDIPESVTNISYNAFSYCTSLESITIPGNVVSVGVFEGCTSLREVILSEGITDLPLKGFNGCSSLERIVIPSTYRGQNKLNSYEIEFDLYYNGNVYDWCQMKFDNYDTSLAFNANDIYFKNDNNEWYLVEDLVIPSEVSVVNAYAFVFFKNIKSLTFSSPTYIEKDALYTYCYSKDNMTLESIYYNGSSDEFVTLALENFDYNISINLEGLYLNNELFTSLIIPEGITTVDSNFFSGIDFITYLYIPESLVSVMGNSLNIHSLTKVNYGGTIESWAKIQFESRYNVPTNSAGNLYINDVILEELSIDLTNYSVDNFIYVKSIKTISYLGDITEIPNSFMSYNDNLETVYIPDTVTKIGTYAFYQCKNLKNIIISENSKLETIEETAFANCGKFESFSIPASLKTFHVEESYRSVIEINKVIYYGTNQQWVNIDFGKHYLYFDEFYINDKLIDTFVFDSSITNESSSNGLYNINTIKNIVYSREMQEWPYLISTSTIENIYYNGSLEEWLLSPYNGSQLSDNIGFYYLDESNEYVNLSKDLVIPNTITNITKENMFGSMTFESVTFDKNINYECEYSWNMYFGNMVEKVYFNGTLQEFLNSTLSPYIQTIESCKLYINGERFNKLIIDDNLDMTNINMLNSYLIDIVYNNTDLPINFNNASEYGLYNMIILIDKNGINDKNSGSYYTIEEENGYYYRSDMDMVVNKYSLVYIDSNCDEITLPVDAFGQRYNIRLMDRNDFSKITIPFGYNFDLDTLLPTKTLEFDSNIKEIVNFDYAKYDTIIFPDDIEVIENSSLTSISDNYLDSLLSKVEVIIDSLNYLSNDNITIYSNIKTINYSFNNCNNLENIIFEEGIETIISSFNNYDYFVNDKLKSITLASSINELNSSFNNFSVLENLYFAKDHNLKVLDSVFANNNIKNLEIPEGIETITNYSFTNSIGLISVSFPTTLKQIDRESFDNCSSLTNLEFKSLNCSISDSFNDCHSISQIEANGDYLWWVDFSNTVFAENNYVDGALYINNSLIDIDQNSAYLRIKPNTINCLRSYDNNIEFIEYDYYSGDILTNIKTVKINNIERGYNFNHLLRGNVENVIIGKDVSYLFKLLNTTDQKFYFEHDKQVVELWGLEFKSAYYKGEWITVTFKENERVISKVPQSKFEIIKIPYYVPSSDNYTNRWLNGWDYDDDNIVDAIPATSNEDITFKAVIDDEQAIYHVTYYDKDGITPIFVDDYSYGQTLILRDEISKKGYTFINWEYELLDNVVCSDLSIYSNWEHIGEHDYSIISKVDATCSERGYTKHTCTVCDEYYLDKFEERLKHEYVQSIVDATCSKEGYILYQCVTCGDNYKDGYFDKIEHNYNDYEILNEATCSENGKQKHECQSCGYVEYEILPMLGHDIIENVVNEATCTHRGQIFYSCGRCEYSEELLTNYLEHVYKEIEISEEFVSEFKNNNIVVYEYLDYYTSYICVNCNHYQSKTVRLEGFILQSSCVHDNCYEVIVIEPTCSSYGLIKNVCLSCNNIASYIQVDKSTCTNEYIIVNPTCENDGYTIIKCSVCQTIDGYINYIDKLGHDYSPNYEWIENECIITLVCNNDSDHFITSDMSITSNVIKNPTCEEDGTKELTATYTYDGQIYSTNKIEVIAALGHTEVVDKEVLPTCTTTGLTEGLHCSVCNKVTLEQTIIKELGHELSDWITDLESTCEKEGLHYKECSRCNYVFEEIISALGHSPLDAVKENEVLPSCEETGLYDLTLYCKVCLKELDRQTTIVPATGHNYNSVVTHPTCESEGYTTHTCHCGKVYTDSIVSSTGHNYSEVVYKWSEDFTSLTATHTCLNDNNHSETETVSTVYEVIVEASCENEGLARCVSDNFTNSSFEPKVYEVVLKALGHTEVVDQEVLPTCTTTGLTEGLHCSVCNKVTLEQKTIEALGHDYEVQIKVDNTCENDGYITYVCTNNSTHTYTEELSATGHNIISHGYKAPTCEEDGYENYEFCNNCSYTSITVIFATGHNYDCVNIVEATCEKAGYMTFVCINDNTHTYDSEIAPTGHKYGEYKYDSVYHWKDCSCGKQEKEEHTFGDWITIEEATKTKEGIKERTCVCGYKETEIIAKIKTGCFGGIEQSIISMISLSSIALYILKKRKNLNL